MHLFLLVIVPLAFLLARVWLSAPTLTDAQGREFIRVRPASDAGDGLTNAELWQLVGYVGEEHPYFLKLLTPEGQPTLFTRTA
jgi:hypothetical protein